MKSVLTIALLLAGLTAFAGEPCKGTTKAGNPCKSKFVSKSGYCRAHDPNKPKPTPDQIRWKKFNKCVGGEPTDFKCDSCYRIYFK